MSCWWYIHINWEDKKILFHVNFLMIFKEYLCSDEPEPSSVRNLTQTRNIHINELRNTGNTPFHLGHKFPTVKPNHSQPGILEYSVLQLIHHCFNTWCLSNFPKIACFLPFHILNAFKCCPSQPSKPPRFKAQRAETYEILRWKLESGW